MDYQEEILVLGLQKTMKEMASSVKKLQWAHLKFDQVVDDVPRPSDYVEGPFAVATLKLSQTLEVVEISHPIHLNFHQ
jgi:hypothetical protein